MLGRASTVSTSLTYYRHTDELSDAQPAFVPRDTAFWHDLAAAKMNEAVWDELLPCAAHRSARRSGLAHPPRCARVSTPGRTCPTPHPFGSVDDEPPLHWPCPCTSMAPQLRAIGERGHKMTW